MIPKIGSDDGQPAVPKGISRNIDATALKEHRKALKILGKSSRKVIAAANRMPLKTRVVTKHRASIPQGVAYETTLCIKHQPIPNDTLLEWKPID
jgi:hypothetical protein